MFENGNFDLAKSYLEQAIERIPGDADLYATYAEVLLYMGRQIESRRELHGIQESPDFTRAPMVVFEKAVAACARKGEVFVKFREIFEKYEVGIEGLVRRGIETGEVEVLGMIARGDEDPAGRFREFLAEKPSRELQVAFADYLCEMKRGEELREVVEGLGELSVEEKEKFAEALLECGELESASKLLGDAPPTKALRSLKLRWSDRKLSDCNEFLRETEPFVRRFRSPEMNSDFLFFVARKIRDLPQWIEIVKQHIPLVSGDVIGAALTVTMLRFGAQAAEAMLNAVMALVVPTPRFITAAIEVVKAQPFVDVQKVRSLHELNVAKWGSTSTEAWLEYARFEYDQKELKKLDAVRWKAIRELKDGARFSEEFAKRFCR
jgi:hypothetical protein